jgi:hopanoid biosynthesis associated RND transporter like protein HpnN
LTIRPINPRARLYAIAAALRRSQPLVRLVRLCVRHPWPVIVIALSLAGFSGIYAARHFAVKTDINDLFPRELPWAQRAYAFMQAFPQRDVIVVVDAPTAEFADAAAAKLAGDLAGDHDHIRLVDAPQSSPFFARSGLLFAPSDDVARMARGMQQAGPLIGSLSADPSLRGALSALSDGLMGVANGVYTLADLTPAMNMAAETVGDALAGRPAHFSWRALAQGKPSDPSALRRFIQVAPVLDFNALEPGRAATDAIAAAARRLDLAAEYQARVRQTGLVPINDDQFATLSHHVVLNLALTIAAVVVILWLALRSWRIIIATLISVGCGLAMAAALGLFLVGALNLISVAFFVLFVGLGVDFGIQFSVRYRAERYETGATRAALTGAARKAGGPLALAAAATALGFSAFVPTEYRGLGELGEIAGPGMIIAFLTSVTLLPALLAVFKSPEEPRPMGLSALAPVDRFLQRWRIPVITVTFAAVALGAPLLRSLPFDFDPIHMSDPRADSVATFLELRREPETGANSIALVKPDLNAADAAAQRLAALPQVGRVTTLSAFIPTDQDKKLALIGQIRASIGRDLNPPQTLPPPSDRQNIDALMSTEVSLTQFAAMSPGPGADAANRLSVLLLQLAKADPAARQLVEAAVVAPLRISLVGLRQLLEAQKVTLATLPPDLTRDWVAPDGRARVQILPKGDPDDTAVLRDFVKAVTAVEPDATGPAVLLYEAGNTIVYAFIEAGVFALAGIFLLLWVTLRRLSDVALTLVPLLLATVVTLELCVVLDLPLNFANIIALPLLLGVGVAFKIYYIMAWRRGRTALVQSTLSRAVIFSAMTTGTAFGSLWLSSHPGTSSMGKLMALALVSTMAAAVLFQPALMGPPRAKATDEAEAEVELEPVDAVGAWIGEPDRPGARGRGQSSRVDAEKQPEDETVSS